MDKNPWLGLYCIVKDAEKTIGTLLSSISGVFEEIVIVDTGSTDSTKKIIEDHFGGRKSFYHSGGFGALIKRRVDPTVEDPNVWLTTFDWVDDFSAARQFSFELGTAKWRCYLDSDDVAEFQHLRRTLARTEKESPNTNIVSIKYDYVPGEMAQDVLRLVRWDDGWKFEDPVHEHLVATGRHGRVISKYIDMFVRHRPADFDEHANTSFDRNIKIIERAYRSSTVTKEKKALWAYYLGKGAHDVGNLELARLYLREAGDGLGNNNLTCDALCHWARMEMKAGNLQKAIDLCGEAIAKTPELPDGYATMGVAQNLIGGVYRAAGLFDFVRQQPKPPVETQHDAIWLDGICAAHAAQAYYRIGRTADANHMISSIPENLLKHPEVMSIGRPTNIALAKTDGFARLQALWEFLIWDTEPLKAKRLLEEFAPAAISDSPQVKQLIRDTEAHMPHMKDWNAYQRVYADIPDMPYHVPPEHRGWTLKQGRARIVRQWAEAMPKKGEPLEVLVVGIQDGIIEGAMMEANPRIVLTACDVAPQASQGINELIERFPGRVKTHKVAVDHYDWFPQGTVGKFDVIIFFEVIEHLPKGGDEMAMRAFRNFLKEDGRLFLSTPIASHWVEQYLSDMKSTRPWYHVRAHNPSTLWALCQKAGFTGSIMGLGDESLFLATLRPAKKWFMDKISIYVYPMKPMTDGIDPFSPKESHCGGSEEAVIYLSAALARAGIQVTVFSDMPRRKDTVFVHEGVAWKTHAELDIFSLEGALLVWRAPEIAAQFKRQNPKLRVLNWLHDTAYDAKPSIYEAVDGTIVLSKFHGEVLSREDGYLGELRYAANGINPEDFPEPDEAKRVPRSCIYAAAPERGLELLLEIWPTVRAAVPDATLNVYYSWVLTEKMLEKRPNPELTALLAKLRRGFEELKEHGVTYHGGVSHQALNKAYRENDVFTFPPIHFDEISCLHGGTRIAMPGDHRDADSVAPRISTLVGRSGFPVYAFDEKELRFKLATVKRVWETKVADELVELVLDDGSVLRVTPDHLIMNFEAEWQAAGDLQVGARLMALHYRYNVMIKDVSGRWVNEHRLVGEWKEGRPLRANEHVDHLEPTRCDNRPEMLEVLTASEHHSRTHKGKVRSGRSKIAQKKAFSLWAQTPDAQAYLKKRNAQYGKTLWEWVNSMPPEERTAWCKARGEKRLAAFKANMEKEPGKYAAYVESCRARAKSGASKYWASLDALSPEEREKALRERAQKNIDTRQARKTGSGSAKKMNLEWDRPTIEFKEFKRQQHLENGKNHKIVEIRRVKGPVKVYDMEVDGLHNFVADGVVVHNCISGMKARASGCWPVIIPTGALSETCPDGDHVRSHDPQVYAEALIKRLLDRPMTNSRRELRQETIWRHNWDDVAKTFIDHARAENDRITIFAGGFGRRFDCVGSADGKPLGGSEEAVIRLAKALTDRGEEVVVYAPLPEGGNGPRQGPEGFVDGAIWRDASTFDPAGPHGTLLAWRCPKLLPQLKGNGYPVILWLMDPEYGARPCDYAEADAMVVLTRTHAEIIRRKDGYGGHSKVVHIGLPELPTIQSTKREAQSVMWATSPDRGLLEFLQEVWPEVLLEVSDAQLHIFYGLEPLIAGGKAELARAIELEIKEATNVTYHGGVPDAELYEWYQRCGVFAYRAVGFEETLSISTLKAMALGCYPVVNDTGCLGEIAPAFSNENYTAGLIATLQSQITNEFRDAMAGTTRDKFSVDSMMKKMMTVIDEVKYDARCF